MIRQRAHGVLKYTSKSDTSLVSRLYCSDISPERESLLNRYREVRRFSAILCETLEPEDCVIQTMPEMSPTKWHLAHTSWFFETFVIKPTLAHYQPLNPQYAYHFNSYYNAAGKMHARPQRGLVSRPTLRETFTYRQHVDSAIEELLNKAEGRPLERLKPLMVLGLNHEQQHQELMLTDIKHAFWMNPLHPMFRPEKKPLEAKTTELGWQSFREGAYKIGHSGEGFHFDNEGPRHTVLLQSFALANRLVTNREYLEFIQEGGYEHPQFWLSLGWIAVTERNWRAPLYWEQRDGDWWEMTLSGMRPIRLEEPVCHLSYFEADAYARWAGARLPSESEWEVASTDLPLEGNFAESGYFHPRQSARERVGTGLQQMYGDLWQWTQSAYSPYPGYRPSQGALGEYNGKFMCNQYVLRGASCATPATHARRTYRNFFPPDARWQFMGIRLAKDT